MLKRKNLRQFISKTIISLVGLATILWSSGILLFPVRIEAAVTERTAAASLLTPGQTIKANSNYTALFGFGLSQSAGETLTGVAFQINQTAGAVSASDFDGVRVYADTGSVDDALDGTDAVCGTQVVVNVDSPTIIDTSAGGGCAIPLAGATTGSYDFLVALKTSPAISNGDAFAFGVNAGPNTYILSGGGTVNATGLTGGNITADTVAPTAAGGGPSDGQIGAPVEALVDRSFNEQLAAGSVATATVSLKTNTGNVQGGAPTGTNLCSSVTLQNNSQVICNHATLTTEVWYTFTITTGVTDRAGNPLAANFTSQFRTGSFGGGAQFNPPPMIIGAIPAGGRDLPVNGKIAINFSSNMKTSGEGSVVNKANVMLYAVSNGVITGSNLITEPDTDYLSWNSANKQLKITPPTLTLGSYYRVVVQTDNDNNPGNNSCGGVLLPACVMNTDGLAMPGQAYTIDFKAVAADTTAPTLVGSYPDAGATGVDRAIYDIAISFNEPLDPATVTTSTVKLYQDNNSDGLIDGGDALINGTTVVLDPDGRVIHLSPNQILSASKKFIIGLTNGIKDIVGNAISITNRTFTTGTTINAAAADTTEPAVMFASADNFSIAVTFSEPVKFNAVANVTENSSDGVNDVNNLSNWTLETSPDGTNWMQNPTTNKQIKYEPYKKTVTIKGLAMPPNGSFRVTASTAIQDLSNNGVIATGRIAQGTVKNASQTGGMLGPGDMAGPVNYFTMGVRPISVFPKTGLAGATSRYKVEFPADTAIPASGKITLTFPSGFSFAGACNTWPTDTFENADINGPATGIVAVASVSCNSVSRVVTITLGSVASQAGDMLRFEVQGVINSTVPKDFSSSGYVVDIKTYNAATPAVLLESKTSMPFFITTPGNYKISGTVFVDSNNNGSQDGAEAGVQNISVCLGGPAVGFQCLNTDANGFYQFTQLNNGFYHLGLPPITSGAYTGGPFFRDININNADAVENFGLQQVGAANILDVYIAATGLNETKLDVFAYSTGGDMAAMGPAGSMGAGGSVVRECTIGTDCDAVQLPLTQGKWQVGVGPWMPKGMTAAPAMPDFSFMPPKPVEVQVAAIGVPDLCTTGAGAAKELCFTLTASSSQIKGKVTDGSGTAISNVFVMARPAFFNEAAGPASAGAGQTDNNGLFNVKVITGTYIVDASMPGMPPSNGVECTVKADTGNVATDGNDTADVYCSGSLVTIASPLILKIAKAGTSVSGRVLDDSSNPIPYAHVGAMEVNDSGNPLGGWADAPTDNSGNYTLYLAGGSAGSPKKWKIRAFAPGFGELPSLTVAVTEGTNLTDKNLQASSSEFGTVTGTVKQNNVGVSGAFVNIHGSSGGNGTVTDASGNYTLKVRAGSGYTIDGFVPSQGPTTSLTNVTVTANSTLADQNLTIAQPATIRVYLCTLIDPNAAPSASNVCADRKVSGAFVGARDSQGKGNSTSSNPTAGQYDLIVPAGTYTVFAGEPTVGPIGSQANVIAVANTTTYVNIVPPALYQVSGTVTSADSACIQGATIFLTDRTNGRVILAGVDTNGAWSQSNIPNGTYSIGAGKPGCVDSADPGTVAVAGANTTAANRTLVKADATISGRVTLNAANVSFDTMVFATSGTGKVVAIGVDTSQTTGNNYTLNVTAGSWTLKARSDGFESGTASVTVASGGTATQDLALSAISGYTRKEPRPYNIKPSQGGIVTNSEIAAGFKINIPAGVLGTSSNDGSVLTKETTSVINTANQTVIGGKGVEITPKDASGQPIKTTSSSSGSGVTITLPYSEADVVAAGGSESNIVIGAWSDEKQQWDPLPTTCDTVNDECTATTTHFSTFALTVPSAGGAPSTPSGLSASAASSSQINLSWTQVSGATSYDIYRSTSSGGTYGRLGSEPTVGSGSTTTYSDTGLAANTTYYYKISALNASGESAASSAVSATTQAAAGGSGVILLPTTPAPTPTPTPQPTPAPVSKPISQMTVAELQAKIVEIMTAISNLEAQLAQLQVQPISAVPSGYQFKATMKLKYGQRSDDIKKLQLFLKAQGKEIYSEGLVTGYFGTATREAVRKFQLKYKAEILLPFGLTEATGIVGEKTLLKINGLLGK